MVAVEVCISQGMDKISGLQSAYLGDHHGQKRIGGNVEGHSQEHVCAALVQLAGQFSVCHIELEQGVTRRQGHLVQLSGIPGAHQHAAGGGIVSDGLQHL